MTHGCPTSRGAPSSPTPPRVMRTVPLSNRNTCFGLCSCRSVFSSMVEVQRWIAEEERAGSVSAGSTNKSASSCVGQLPAQSMAALCNAGVTGTYLRVRVREEVGEGGGGGAVEGGEPEAEEAEEGAGAEEAEGAELGARELQHHRRLLRAQPRRPPPQALTHHIRLPNALACTSLQVTSSCCHEQHNNEQAPGCT
eukprot:373089-Rhodomonas_salina.3